MLSTLMSNADCSVHVNRQTRSCLHMPFCSPGERNTCIDQNLGNIKEGLAAGVAVPPEVLPSQ